MWEFDEAVEVRSGVVDGVETPEQFLWRGRLWRVCSVQAHWTETAAWWERGIIGTPIHRAADWHHAEAAAAVAEAPVLAGAAPTSGAANGAAVGVLDADWGPRRAVYRVEAGCGRHGRRELFDLAHDPDSGRWQLERVTDR
ncbi:DUF6504 family protein [Kribbella sp. NPDC049227]|jgi:Family of unknown function (DUF6504)|uniref:DUF6504 family protein n=1 Tax=Kribbella sp. NPDC049227 TaxID=3364113 RepID=UPI003722BCC1